MKIGDKIIVCNSPQIHESLRGQRGEIVKLYDDDLRLAVVHVDPHGPATLVHNEFVILTPEEEEAKPEPNPTTPEEREEAMAAILHQAETVCKFASRASRHASSPEWGKRIDMGVARSRCLSNLSLAWDAIRKTEERMSEFVERIQSEEGE